jgi:hypothetical protein
MRFALSRPRRWLAGALLALAWAAGCDLNPQPLPPSDRAGSGNDNGGSSPTGAPPGSPGSGSSSGTNFGGSGSGSGSGSTTASSSGAGPGAASEAGVLSDAGVLVEEDATVADGGNIAIDAAADGGAPFDSGSDGSADAAADGGAESDAACVRAWDCTMSHPGKCSSCAWPLNYAVCVEGQCACACEERDAAGEQ